jgi:hypothetical protein
MNDETPSPFQDMAPAETMAYLHKTEGDAALIAFLQLSIDPHSSPRLQQVLGDYDPKSPATTREALERDADELEALGLPAGVIVREYAALAPSAQPVCPFPEGDAGFVNWHLNVRPKDPTPFRDKEDGEDCLINAGYRFDDDGVWRNRSGETEGMVLPSEDGQGFRIVRLRAGADWRRHL